MSDPVKRFVDSKFAEWAYRALVIVLLAALAFLRDSATKNDLVPIRADLTELKRAVVELDKKMAVNEALRARAERRSGD